jgi:hypothetical protein
VNALEIQYRKHSHQNDKLDMNHNLDKHYQIYTWNIHTFPSLSCTYNSVRIDIYNEHKLDWNLCLHYNNYSNNKMIRYLVSISSNPCRKCSPYYKRIFQNYLRKKSNLQKNLYRIFIWFMKINYIPIAFSIWIKSLTHAIIFAIAYIARISIPIVICRTCANIIITYHIIWTFIWMSAATSKIVSKTFAAIN